MFSFYTIGCLRSRKEHCFNWTRESLYGQQHPQQQLSHLILGSALWTLNPWRDGWLLPSIGMYVFSGRKRRIFGTHVPFRNMDLALTGIFPYWIELCCAVGWQKRKKKVGGEWPMHVTGENTRTVLVQVCWVTMTVEMERLRKDHSSCPPRILCAAWPPLSSLDPVKVGIHFFRYIHVRWHSHRR